MVIREQPLACASCWSRLARDSPGRISWRATVTDGSTPPKEFSAECNSSPPPASGDKGDQPGGFGAYNFGNLKNTFGPIGIMLDQHDRVWGSSLNDRVQCFTPAGKFLLGLGGSGSDPGQFIHPHGMAFDSHGHLYVADAGNQRIQKFEIPQP